MASEAYPPADDALRRTLEYHRRTKHHPHRYAAGPGHLDWATQPDPFRTFSGSEAIPLPLVADTLDTSFEDLYHPLRTPSRPLALEGIAALFELGLGLSAWKAIGSNRWALRCNPSSGNLHPTEGYIVAPAIPGLPAGVYHYVSRDHVLERRCRLGDRAVTAMSEWLGEGRLLVGLSSIHWREAWKYGERAYRYCQHDVGHALASLRFAAAILGWRLYLVDSAADSDVAAILGLDRESDFIKGEGEHPDALLLCCTGPVQPDEGEEVPARHTAGLDAATALFHEAEWQGGANRLSPSHHPWPIIEEVASATTKPRIDTVPPHLAGEWPPPIPQNGKSMAGAALIRQRRSAVSFDGRTHLPAPALFHILDRLLPRSNSIPWDLWPWPPHIQLLLMVHRVDGLAPGLYCLPRSEYAEPALRTALHGDFAWERPDGAPSHLPLFYLHGGDLRETGRQISCLQEIAGDSCFTLGMVAALESTMRERGAWYYRRLFWEAGLVGQVLYLEAEAAGVRGTGIGCYFDDLFHELLGIRNEEFQSLYHFTVGGPVEDPRLTTLPPYAHLEQR